MEERIDVINGKRVKVTIKNLTKNTSACDICRDRKKKCDGKAPCSYCVANNKVCLFSQRRKRGPKFKVSASRNESPEEFKGDNRTNDIIGNNNSPFNLNTSTVSPFHLNASTVATRANTMSIFNAATARYECEIIDKLEGNAFKEFYLMFVNPYMHLNAENIMSPVTVAHRVQAYSALAMAARLCGDRSKAQTYMSQARLLAGSVFDSPNADTVGAMLMLAQFCRLTLDIPLYKYYSHLAYGLTRVAPSRIQGKLGVQCEMYNIMQKDELTYKQQAAYIKQCLAGLAASKSNVDTIYMLFCEMASLMLGVCGVNLVIPDLNNLQNCFYLLKNAKVNPEERVEMLRVIDAVKANINTVFSKEMKAVYVNTFYHPVYCAITEWRSGHFTEAIDHAVLCMESLQQLSSAGYIAIVAKPTHVAIMGALVELFYEQGHYQLAEQMCKHIKHICEILSPEYDFLRLRVDEYMSSKLTNCNPPNTAPIPTDIQYITNNNNTPITFATSTSSALSSPTHLSPDRSPLLPDNYTYSYMNNDLNMMDMNVVNLIDLSAVEGMWVNVMNS